MGTYQRNEYDGGRLERRAICDAMAAGWAEGNTVCALCGMTLVELPVEDSDYVNMIIGGCARRRRPQ